MIKHIALLFFLALAFTACKKDDNNDDKISDNLDSARIIFLHHSTGGNVWGGGVEDWITNFNEQNSKAYSIEERAYPENPWPWANYPADYYKIWIKHQGNNNSGTERLESLTTKYNIIIFKHCFPVSDIQEDEATTDASSDHKSLANYKAAYNELKTLMNSFPKNYFIVWTGAALTKASTNENNAKRMQQFVNWVKNDWDKSGDNIFIWDFYSLETEGGLYLKDGYAASSNDSHPNDEFCRKVAPYFAQRIVNVIQGKGDNTSITGKN